MKKEKEDMATFLNDYQFGLPKAEQHLLENRDIKKRSAPP